MKVFLQYCIILKDCKKGGVDEINRQTQTMSVVLTGYLCIGHILYSISYPSGANSFFESNLYQQCISLKIISVPLERVYSKSLETAGYMVPIDEFIRAHDILLEFMDPFELYAKARHLLFVTFHIQVGMGFLGISFLRAEQSRKNALVQIEQDIKKEKEEEIGGCANGISNGSQNGVLNGTSNSTGKRKKGSGFDHSAKFRKSAGPFIFFVALPYMMQIVFFGGMNMYAADCFRNDIHRTIRLNDLFANEGSRFVATATSKESKLSPDGYASNADIVVKTVYDTFNRVFFSLPKLLLLPSIVAKQPMLVVQITPLILLSDYIKSAIVAVITTEVERVKKEVKNVSLDYDAETPSITSVLTFTI